VRRWFGLLILLAISVGHAGGQPVSPARSSDGNAHGKITIARLRWRSDMGFTRGGFGSAWNHDYPRAERHLSLIARELTVIDIRIDADVVLSLDDPELFNYPIAFMWEPGFWNLTDAEAASFRAYLRKGGFVVFEDFDGPQQWAHFERQMRRVLPEGRLVELDSAHPIFDSFFRIRDIHAIVHPMTGIRPSYYGIFEDNDPAQRLMVVANFDNDVPEYWEWSGEGIYAFDASNDAYKLGVNYLIYGLTH
jgi:Domain of unknown function (DUF4159)